MNKIDIQDERDAARRLAASAETFGKVRAGLNAVIFGQDEVIEQTLLTLLARHTDLGARQIAQESMAIAAGICIYTNDSITIEGL